jgi:hypothetical protein
MPSAILIDPGDGQGRQVGLVGDRLTIGRRPGNDLRLPHGSVSGSHAALVLDGSTWFVEDLGSRNGTLVNGRKISRHRLADRDVVEVGVHRIVFQARALFEPVQPESEAVAPAAARRRSAVAAKPAGSAFALAQPLRAGETEADYTPDVHRAVQMPMPGAVLRVRAGARRPVEVPIRKVLTSIGHAGAVVGWIAWRDGAFYAVPGDGPLRMTFDGVALENAYRRLAPADSFRVGEAEVEIRLGG